MATNCLKKTPMREITPFGTTDYKEVKSIFDSKLSTKQWNSTDNLNIPEFPLQKLPANTLQHDKFKWPSLGAQTSTAAGPAAAAGKPKKQTKK